MLRVRKGDAYPGVVCDLTGALRRSEEIGQVTTLSPPGTEMPSSRLQLSGEWELSPWICSDASLVIIP